MNLFQVKIRRRNIWNSQIGNLQINKEKVTIKILEKSKLKNYNIKKREINILNKILHPNIVKLFCLIETDRQILIII